MDILETIPELTAEQRLDELEADLEHAATVTRTTADSWAAEADKAEGRVADFKSLRYDRVPLQPEAEAGK